MELNSGKIERSGIKERKEVEAYQVVGPTAVVLNWEAVLGGTAEGSGGAVERGRIGRSPVGVSERNSPGRTGG